MSDPSKAKLLNLYKAMRELKRAKEEFAEQSAILKAQIREKGEIVNELLTELSEGRQGSLEDMMEGEGGEDDDPI
jgi:predicted nucleotide-binding protein (sugar kinase/HSP70/actin superfamily)